MFPIWTRLRLFDATNWQIFHPHYRKKNHPEAGKPSKFFPSNSLRWTIEKAWCILLTCSTTKGPAYLVWPCMLSFFLNRKDIFNCANCVCHRGQRSSVERTDQNLPCKDLPLHLSERKTWSQLIDPGSLFVEQQRSREELWLLTRRPISWLYRNRSFCKTVWIIIIEMHSFVNVSVFF